MPGLICGRRPLGYYTPEYIVRHIVENTVGKLITGKTPDQIGTMNLRRFVVERFSADFRMLRNGTTTALKRSTTNDSRYGCGSTIPRFMERGLAVSTGSWREAIPLTLPSPARGEERVAGTANTRRTQLGQGQPTLHRAAA
jgi:hypothetical protein